MKPLNASQNFDWQKYLEPAIKIIIEGIVILDGEGRIVYVNDAAERMLGRARSEIIGCNFQDPIWDVRTPEGLPFPEEDRPFARAMTENEPVYGVELSVLRPDGTRPVLSFSAMPLRDETGARIASVQSFSDITDRNTDIYQNLVGVLIVALNAEGKITMINRRGAEILGLPEDEIIGKDWFENFIPERIKDEVKDIFYRLMAGEIEPLEHYDNPLVNSQGEERIMAWHNALLRDSEGNITGTLSSGDDVTERRKAEKLLSESESQLKIVLESTDEGIYGLDEERRCTFFNKAASKMTGFKPEEVLGEDIHALIHHSRADGSAYPVEECPTTHSLQTGQGTRTDAEVFWRKDGTSFPVEFSSYPVTQDSLRGAVVAFADITERKRTEEEIQEHHEELKERDRAIRTAYVDVISAVTGGKLVLMSAEEIEEALGAPLMDGETVDSFEDLSVMRHTMTEAVRRVAPDLAPERFIVALSEALTNAVKHSGSGTSRLYRKGPVLQIVISDSGPGIDFRTLPKATLMPGFSTKGSLGMGFSIMLEVCDRVLLATQPGNTTVVLEVGA